MEFNCTFNSPMNWWQFDSNAKNLNHLLSSPNSNTEPFENLFIKMNFLSFHFYAIRWCFHKQNKRKTPIKITFTNFALISMGFIQSLTNGTKNTRKKWFVESCKHHIHIRKMQNEQTAFKLVLVVVTFGCSFFLSLDIFTIHSTLNFVDFFFNRVFGWEFFFFLIKWIIIW